MERVVVVVVVGVAVVVAEVAVAAGVVVEEVVGHSLVVGPIVPMQPRSYSNNQLVAVLQLHNPWKLG